MALWYIIYFQFCGWRRVLTLWTLWCIMCIPKWQKCNISKYTLWVAQWGKVSNLQFHVLAEFSALTLLVARQEGHLACKNWVLRYWRGYLSGARYKWSAYGSADATATPSSLPSLKSRMVYLSGAGFTQVVREKRPLNGCSVVWYRSTFWYASKQLLVINCVCCRHPGEIDHWSIDCFIDCVCVCCTGVLVLGPPSIPARPQ